MSQDLIRIGYLSRVTGVPIATLRFYVSEGQIECERNRSKYRMFSKETIDIVLRILHLKSLMIPLAEIRLLLRTDEMAPDARELSDLEQRLAHILERKVVWEEEERKVRLLLECSKPKEGDPDARDPPG